MTNHLSTNVQKVLATMLFFALLAVGQVRAQGTNNDLPCLPAHGESVDVTAWCGEEIITQTISLAAGWNWVSFNAETTLADLKTAIADVVQAGDQPIIKSKGNGQVKKNANNNNWVGPLKQLDLSQMYKIKVGAACEITLQGEAVDPTEHSFTIKKGPNWIAYPLTEEMTIANAFSNFNAAIGDVVKGLGIGSATKRSNNWTGTLKKLTPGIGYIYNSTATEDKTLVFPTSAK